MQPRFEENINLAYYVARRFKRRVQPQDHEDLEQVALVGLWKACQRFDPERGTKFSTFAVPYISGEIQKWIRDQHNGRLRIGRTLMDRYWRMKKAYVDLEQRLGRTPTFKEIGEETGMTESEVLEVFRADVISIEEPVAGGITIADTLSCGDATFDEVWLRSIQEMADEIDPVMADYVVRDLTQQTIADKRSISQAQVSRRVSMNLQVLRERLGA